MVIKTVEDDSKIDLGNKKPPVSLWENVHLFVSTAIKKSCKNIGWIPGPPPKRTHFPFSRPSVYVWISSDLKAAPAQGGSGLVHLQPPDADAELPK